MRLFGVSESAVARALAEAGGDGDGVEVTICARDFEIHVDFVVQPGAEARADALEAAFIPPIERWLYGRDERGVEEHVLELCRARGLTLATAESCTGGLVAARLTSVPGSSERRARRHRRLRGRGEAGRAGRPARSCSPRTVRCPQRWQRRWRAARGSGSGPTLRFR